MVLQPLGRREYLVVKGGFPKAIKGGGQKALVLQRHELRGQGQTSRDFSFVWRWLGDQKQMF